MRTKSGIMKIVWFSIIGLCLCLGNRSYVSAETYNFVLKYGSPSGSLSYPSSLAIDSAGNMYVADTDNDRIMKISSAGVLITSWGTYGSGNGKFKAPMGVAIDSTDNVYVTDSGNNRIQKFTSVGVFIATWGAYGTGNGNFKYPCGVAVDSIRGHIYVADSGNNRIQKFKSDSGEYVMQIGSGMACPSGVAVDSAGNVYVADSCNDRIQKYTANGSFITKWGSAGNGNGRFNNPAGIAIDSGGTVYVADTGNDRIQSFTSTGSFIAAWGSYGTANGYFANPGGVAVDNTGNVYIADSGNDRIQKCTSAGNFLWSSADYTGNGKFNFPVGVVTDSAGNVYVADSYNHRIQKFTAAGVFSLAWGTYGTGNGQFDTPRGVAVDSSGNVYVADSYNNRIQKFTAAGVFVTAWGCFNYPCGVAVDSTGDVYVADYNCIIKFSSTGTYLTSWGTLGSGTGQFYYPFGLAVDGADNVFVADSYNNRIQKFSSSGVYKASWGTEGTADGQFAHPAGVAVDSGGYVYVADSYNNRIQKFSPAGVFITKWGSRGVGDGQFFNPMGLTMDTDTYVYVADTDNNSIQKFIISGIPALNSFQINNNAGTTTSRTITLNNTATNSPTQYLASESSSFSGAVWKTYESAPSFTLSSFDGTKTVYLKVKNGDDESGVLYDTITLHEKPAISSFSINDGASKTTTRKVTLNNIATNFPTYYMASESSTFSGASWIAYSTAPSFTLSSGNGVKTVYFKVKNAYATSAVTSDTITLNEKPTIKSFLINSDAATTTSRKVTLNNSATNSPTHYMASESSTFSGASWIAYSTAPSYTLRSGDGVKTVYFKVKNTYGETAASTDTITLNEKPAVTSFLINNGDASTTNRTVTLNNVATMSPTHYMASESSDFVGANWLPYSATPPFILSSETGSKTVYFKVKNAYDESTVKKDTITLE